MPSEQEEAISSKEEEISSIQPVLFSAEEVFSYWEGVISVAVEVISSAEAVISASEQEVGAWAVASLVVETLRVNASLRHFHPSVVGFGNCGEQLVNKFSKITIAAGETEEDDLTMQKGA